ncbi:hypothetical protein V7S43_007301 [Phytophthora oleae]|uniref:Uncharacterized protein n=1 Tax=Phytophthora oleae TaxID=2107226 RepID=A0ABD3FLX2_9STRA
MRLLLQRGAMVDPVDRMDRTPLMMAAYRGHKDAVQLLLDSGASLSKTDRMGQTPQEVAQSNNKVDIDTLLVYKARDGNVRRRRQESAVGEPRAKSQRRRM